MAVALLPAPAHAKYAFQGMLTLTGGWTSNATGAATAPGQPEAADFFGVISPSIVFTSGVARAVNRVSYNFSAQLYVSHPELASYANRVDWAGFFTPSPNTQLLLGVTGTQSQLNTVNALTTTDSSQTPIQVTTVGTEQYFGVSASEMLLWGFARVARLYQSAGFAAFIPQARGLGDTYHASGALGLERAFRRDGFAGELRLDYTYFAAQRGPTLNPDGSVNPDGEVVPARQHLTSNLLFRWRRDFGNFWNTELAAGVVMVMRANDGGGQIWQPMGLAAVRYLHPRGSVDLSYSHAVAPNALVQQTYASDTVTLRGSVPLGVKSRVFVSAGGGYSHGVVINSESGQTGSAVDLFLADATLNWAPLSGLSLFTRYQYSSQLPDAGQSPPIPSISRHLVMVGVSGIYPTQAAAVVPSRLALRVDGSDNPGIPDPHSPAPAK
jgi:hypothetical protein